MQQTPLFWAAVGGNLLVLELLLAQQADPCHQDMHKMTALFYAVKHDASIHNSQAGKVFAKDLAKALKAILANKLGHIWPSLAFSGPPVLVPSLALIRPVEGT